MQCHYRIIFIYFNNLGTYINITLRPLLKCEKIWGRGNKSVWLYCIVYATRNKPLAFLTKERTDGF